MKKLVSMVMGLAAAAALAIPMPQVQVLTFSVQGNETYADGSPLADGECYALVWSADGVFEGLNADGTAKGAGDEVVYIGQIVKGADVVFQIADGFKGNTGYFDIWILDTRVFENGESKSIGKSSDGKVMITYAAKATGSAVKVEGAQSAPTVASGVEGGAVVSAPTVDLGSVQKPVISGLSFETDAKGGQVVVITLEKTVLGARYAVQGSATPTMQNAVRTEITTGTGRPMQLIAPKTGNFINVIVTDVAK